MSQRAKGPYTVIGYDAERDELVKRPDNKTLHDAKLEATLIKTDPEYANDLQRVAIYDANSITVEDIDLSPRMSVYERIEYVNNICDRLRERLLSKVEQFPKEWDGIDISNLFAIVADEMFASSKSTNVEHARYKAVKNEYIVKNL